MTVLDRIPDLPNEEWRAIDGYDGKYLVSNQGRIKSLKHTVAKLLTAFRNNKGYYRVCLYQNGQSKYLLVSRLVATAFCENDDPENRNTVDHIDGNKKNNCASNLYWCSLEENIRKEKKNNGYN